MRYFIIIILLLGCKDKLEKQQVVFKDYDFTTGNYRLFFYEQMGTRIEELNGFDNFYISDIETLEKIKKHWIISYKTDAMPCGYTYAVVLKKNDNVAKRFYVNLDCEYTTTIDSTIITSSWLRFPKSYITDYKKYFKKIDLK